MSNQPLNMAQLAGADESKLGPDQMRAEAPEPAAPVTAPVTAPARKPQPPKAPKFDHRTKHLFTVEGEPELRCTGTVFSEHADGTTATVSVHCPISELTVLSSKSVGELAKNDEVTFHLAPDYPLRAKFRCAHAVREGKEPMCTLHLKWPTASIMPAPEPTRKGGKRKAEPAESEPESKALKEGLKVPDNVLCSIYLSMDDFLTEEPSLAEIAARMLEIRAHLAHLLPADMPAGTLITALLDPRMGAYLNDQFKVNQDAASRAMKGFSLVTSPFSPKKDISLVQVRDFLKGIYFAKGESFSVVLGYDNASVVDETYPDMAFGDNKRALEWAARAQSPARSDSDSDFIDLRDSDSDDE